MNITIVGVGALGSHAVQLLRNAGQLKVIDMDVVERKNVLSQFHNKTSVGKKKTQSIQQAMQLLYGVKVVGIPHKLVADNADQLLGGSDLVLDCLDNGAARTVVQKYVRKNDLPCLHGALAAEGAMGRVVWDSKFSIDDDGAGGATCEDGEHLPFIMLVSSYLARSAQEFLSSGKQLSYQLYPRSPSTKL